MIIPIILCFFSRTFFLLTVYKILLCTCKYNRLFEANLPAYINLYQVIITFDKRKSKKKEKRKIAIKKLRNNFWLSVNEDSSTCVIFKNIEDYV